MPEHSLGELQELSAPALRHAELIQIARIETPNKADEKASVRWPRRQAKATRFLAMLRRDYGSESFEALVSQLEHARSFDSEHAQGDRSMLTFDSVYPVGIRHLFFCNSRCGEYKLQTLQIVEYRSGWSDVKNPVQVVDEFNRFQLDQSQREELVRRVIISMESALASDPKLGIFRGGEVWAAALVAIREVLPNDKELLRKVLLFTLVHMGSVAEHAGSFRYAMGATAPREAWNDERVSLQCVIDYLLEQGCSEDEVATAWEQMLIKRASQGYWTSLVFSWWKGLQIHKKNQFLDKFAHAAARMCVEQDLRWYLENPRSDLFGSHLDGIEPITEDRLQLLQDMVLDCGTWDWRDMFEDKLVTCFARGQAAKACYFVTALYRYFGHCYVERGIMPRKHEVREPMEKLMRAAIGKAQDESNFGIACALAEHLGEIELADMLREHARRVGQRIALDCAIYVHVDSLKFKKQ